MRTLSPQRTHTEMGIGAGSTCCYLRFEKLMKWWPVEVKGDSRASGQPATWIMLDTSKCCYMRPPLQTVSQIHSQTILHAILSLTATEYRQYPVLWSYTDSTLSYGCIKTVLYLMVMYRQYSVLWLCTDSTLSYGCIQTGSAYNLTL
jgi:hypothetical protein